MPSDLASFPSAKRLRYRLEHAALRAAADIVPLLPYEALEPLANAIGSAAYHLDARGRNTAHANLAVVFPERSADDRARIARGSYQSFARAMLCLFWSPNLNPGTLDHYVSIEGLHDHPIHLDPTRAGLYYTFHFSNFEWFGHASANAVTPGLIVTQQFKNPLIGPIFDSLRSNCGHTVVPQTRAIIRILKHLKAGKKTGAVTDLSLDPKHGAIPIKCFGLWTPASPLLSVIVERTDALLVPSQTFPDPNGRFRLRYHPPVELPPNPTPQQVTQAAWDVMEVGIRSHPECWLWAYKQWRFRPTDTEGKTYPTYANTAKRFDKLLAEHRGE